MQCMRQRLIVGGVFLFVGLTSAQQLPKLPAKMPGVVNMPRLWQQPVKTAKPVYPQGALDMWAEGTITLDVLIDTSGKVEQVGCDDYCRAFRPDMVEAAANAVRQFEWNPIVEKGKPVRVLTRVSIPFQLDENSPPISVCNVLHNPKAYNDRVLNVFGTAKHADILVLTSANCEGRVVISEHGDVTPTIEDAKFAQFQQAVSVGPVTACLRGLMREDRNPGDFSGERLVLERVLKCPTK